MAVNLNIRVNTVGGNRLVDDYVRGDAPLAPFFAGHAFDPEAYRRKAAEVRDRFDPAHLGQMAAAVRVYGDTARDKLERIAAGDGFFITTGQQPGLFGGPLYTVYKTLTAVRLATSLEALIETPVLPVFWIASDDHDWEEANHAHILDTGNDLHRLELEGGAEPPRSMGRRALDGAAEHALAEMEQLLPPSEFTPAIMKRLRDAYEGGTVAEAFADTLRGLFHGLALGYVDAQDPALRELSRPVLRRELERAEAHESALRSQTERLVAAGYDAQVPILPGATNVFYEDPEGGRERLLREGQSWVLRASKRTLDEAELWSLFEQTPERFSANVVLRPVLESAVFPTLAYVGGPGEVRYLAQTGCLFEAHGVGMPLVFPRLGATLVERKVGKVLEKFDLSGSDLLGRPIHEVIASVVRDDVPEGVEAAAGRIRSALQEGYEALFEAAREIDPTLKGPIFHARGEGFKALADVEKKVRQHLKAREETQLEQIEKAAMNLAPQGKPQERVFNVHQYLARYGPALIPAILEAMEIELNGAGGEWGGVKCEPE